jgi:hypothetical protein
MFVWLRAIYPEYVLYVFLHIYTLFCKAVRDAKIPSSAQCLVDAIDHFRPWLRKVIICVGFSRLPSKDILTK